MHKWREMHGCILSFVVTVALVLQYSISISRADLFISLGQFYTQIFHLSWRTLDSWIKFWKKNNHWFRVNTLKPGQNWLHFKDKIFKCMFWMKFVIFWFQCVSVLLLRVYLMLSHHWFSHYMNQCWPTSMLLYDITRTHIFQTTFSNAFSCLKMYEFGLRFHWNLFLRFELTIFQHWFW